MNIQKVLNNKITVYTLVILGMMLWGISFIWGKIALETYTPLTVMFFRTIVATLVILPILIIKRNLLVIKKSHIPHFLLLAFFEPFLYFMGETNGLKFVDAATSSVIIATIPLFTPFVAYMFLKDKITLLNVIGIIVSIIGICIIVLDKNLGLSISSKGLMFLSLAVVAALAYSVKVSKMPSNYGLLTLIFYQNLFGAIFYSPFFILKHAQTTIETGFVVEPFFAIIKLGIFGSTIAFLFYMHGLRNMKISQVNSFTNIIPVFTMVFSFFILEVNIPILKVLGIIITVFGVFVSQFQLKKKWYCQK